MELNEQSPMMQNFRQRQEELATEEGAQNAKQLSAILPNTLRTTASPSVNSQTQSPTDGAPTASPQTISSENGRSSVTTTSVAVPSGRNGLVPGTTGSPAALSREVQEIKSSIAELLPPPLRSWLATIATKGWMAGEGPERTESLLADTREGMRLMFQLWRPVMKQGQHARLGMLEQISKMLSAYGFGAMPSDPVQATLKMEAFSEVLEEYPGWAIEAAGKWWRKNNAEAPAPKQWADRCRFEMGWYDHADVGDGKTVSLGSIHDRVTRWAKGESIWGNV